MAAMDIQEVARAKLGRTRFFMRGELRRTRKTLRPGERVLSMAVGTRGLKGRLIVATDQRFLLVRSRGCEVLPYESLISVTVDHRVSCNAAELVLATPDKTHTFHIAPQPRAVELARVGAPRLGAERVLIKGSSRGRMTGGSRRSRSPAAVALSVLLWGATGFLVFGWLFGNEPDGDRRPDRRRAPTFAAGGCTAMSGTVVSCDDTSKAFFKLVARPAGARRCSPDSRINSGIIRQSVAKRLNARRLCLDVFLAGDD